MKSQNIHRTKLAQIRIGARGAVKANKNVEMCARMIAPSIRLLFSTAPNKLRITMMKKSGNDSINLRFSHEWHR